MKQTLTDISGIGEATAALMIEHGIDSIETLTEGGLKKLILVPGFGEKRAATVLAAANALEPIEEAVKGSHASNVEKKPRAVKKSSTKKAKKKKKSSSALKDEAKKTKDVKKSPAKKDDKKKKNSKKSAQKTKPVKKTSAKKDAKKSGKDKKGKKKSSKKK